jgi:CubicO group peptidase (beta-lactamase class C family)
MRHDFFAVRLGRSHGSRQPGSGPSSTRPRLGKAFCVLMLLGALLSPQQSFAGHGAEIPDVLTSQVWIGKAGPDDVVFRLWLSVDGTLAGEAHTIRSGKHRTQSPATSVVWNNPDIEIFMNTGVIFRGTLDGANARIDGRLDYQGETIAELPLDGVAPRQIDGLLARPAPPDGEPLYSYSVPPKTSDGWEPSGPEAVGLEQTQLEALVIGIIDGKAGLLHSLLLVHKGKLVLEEYFHGYEREDLHRLASVTKSVSSLLTGIAIDRKEIAGVDAPLIDFFPHHEDLFKNEWKTVTLKHLLTMSIGTSWTEEEADRTHGTGDAFFRELLSRSFSHTPGEQWQYVSANVNLLGGVIKKATGVHADEFAADHLFEPLGIKKWSWDYGMVDGYRLMDGSLSLRPRDMAKLGALITGHGRWKNKQIVSEEWIRESTSPHAIPSENAPEKYGYLWWLFYLPSNAGLQEAVIANGKGSQFIAVFPALDLVVVTTGSNDENGKQFAIGRLLSEHILDNVQVQEQ